MKNKTEKQEQAAVRQAEYNALTLEQKIAQCRNRRGENRRELKRLLAKQTA